MTTAAASRSTWPRTSPASTTPPCGAIRAPAATSSSSSFAHFARTAERAKFDFLFLAEGLRLREQNGQIYDLDVVGPPGHLHRAGRAGRGHRPARAGRHDQLHLQRAVRGGAPVRHPRPPVRRAGRLERRHLLGRLHRRELPPRRLPAAGGSATTGPGQFLQHRLGAVRLLARRRDRRRQGVGGVPAPTPGAGRFEHHDDHFDIAGQFNVPRSPQGRPVIFQAGDSDEGREFAAASADAIFSRHGTLEAGQAFYADVKGRLARYGRTPDQLLILPAATFVLGDTDAEAQELAREVRLQQVSGQTAIKFARAAVEPGPVRLRPRRPAARRRPRGRERTPSPTAGPASGCTGIRSPPPREWRRAGRGGATCRSASWSSR